MQVTLIHKQLHTQTIVFMRLQYLLICVIELRCHVLLNRKCYMQKDLTADSLSNHFLLELTINLLS